MIGFPVSNGLCVMREHPLAFLPKKSLKQVRTSPRV